MQIGKTIKFGVASKKSSGPIFADLEVLGVTVSEGQDGTFARM